MRALGDALNLLIFWMHLYHWNNCFFSPQQFCRTRVQKPTLYYVFKGFASNCKGMAEVIYAFFLWTASYYCCANAVFM